jgi:GNAT superfamily N-acetyltransferase
VFKSIEVVTLEEVLCEYFATNKARGHRSLTYVADSQIRGLAYFAPAAMTDRTWRLNWIAVLPGRQTQGIGSQLIAQVEQEIRAQRGRLLLVETSSLAHYEPARKFYAKHGYSHAATIADYFACGDDLLVFRKTLA